MSEFGLLSTGYVDIRVAVLVLSASAVLEISLVYQVTSPLAFPRVSKSRKQIFNFSFEPKNKRNYFCISALGL